MSSSAINSRGVAYDYDSVMHYHSTAFGGGRITITRKDGSTKLGNTRGMSPKDIRQANLMYCNGRPTNRPVVTKPPTGKHNVWKSSVLLSCLALSSILFSLLFLMVASLLSSPLVSSLVLARQLSSLLSSLFNGSFYPLLCSLLFPSILFSSLLLFLFSSLLFSSLLFSSLLFLKPLSSYPCVTQRNQALSELCFLGKEVINHLLITKKDTSLFPPSDYKCLDPSFFKKTSTES